MPETDKPVDATRGTAIWGLNRLRSDLLPALLADLAKREIEGIDSHQCMRVTKTLAQLVDSAAALSAGESAWKTALQADLTAFQEIFVAHNMDLENTDDAIKNRVVTLTQLHTVRQKLSHRIRRNLRTIEREVHIRAVESTFASFRDLSTEFPDTLPQVGSAVARFFAGLIAKSELHHPG
jgi:hypothetical protein